MDYVGLQRFAVFVQIWWDEKQLDAYVQYDSKRFGKIVNRYCGSIFVGHCKSTDLKDNVFKFGEKLSWDIMFLLQIGMDGPKVNISFQKLLESELKETNNKTIIDIGPCGLHVVHISIIMDSKNQTLISKVLHTICLSSSKIVQPDELILNCQNWSRKSRVNLYSDVYRQGGYH